MLLTKTHTNGVWIGLCRVFDTLMGHELNYFKFHLIWYLRVYIYGVIGNLDVSIISNYPKNSVERSIRINLQSVYTIMLLLCKHWGFIRVYNETYFNWVFESLIQLMYWSLLITTYILTKHRFEGLYIRKSIGLCEFSLQITYLMIK